MDETNVAKCRILVTMCGRLFFVFDHKRKMLRQKTLTSRNVARGQFNNRFTRLSLYVSLKTKDFKAIVKKSRYHYHYTSIKHQQIKEKRTYYTQSLPTCRTMTLLQMYRNGLPELKFGTCCD